MTRDPFTAGFVEVTLPVAGRVRGVLPTLPDLFRQQLVPNHLRQVVLHFADPAWLQADGEDPAEVADRAKKYVEAVRLLVARFITHVWDDDAQDWRSYDRSLAERLSLLPSAETPGGMAAIDYDLLEDLVLGLRDADEVTAIATRRRGDAEKEAAAPDSAAETFPGGPDGAPGRPDGEGVGDPVAISDVPRGRARRQRVPDGRGAGNAP